MNKWERRSRKVDKKRDTRQLSKPFRQSDGESSDKKATRIRLKLARRAKEDVYNTDDINEEE